MLNLNQSNKFKKDYKLCKKRGYHMDLLQSVINTLRIPEPLPAKNKDHSLSGNFVGKRECHISPDWLLIYQIIGNELYLVRTGTHSDLLNM
ncbi:MAG: type II toxin-antitoxin system YafQ family toxin [Schaedlerella sp.]|uniref:type II toxin-antitoxin system YafQ family toxin n=1 Tax=Schaedlerella sp. TaxID=2676057 RepID=UPI0026336593|nr:type II toxin-antitoxin system YafQ family toxin [uncultured Schaedlerella sp.]